MWSITSVRSSLLALYGWMANFYRIFGLLISWILCPMGNTNNSSFSGFLAPLCTPAYFDSHQNLLIKCPKIFFLNFFALN